MALHNWQPLISVVLVTYNGAAFITQQLTTVLEQTYKHVEIIILDNASTDNTWELLSAFAEKDNRIQLHYNKENKGANKGFEQAIYLSKGELIAPCDQDDIWELNKIELMLSAFTPETEYMFSTPGQFNNDDFKGRKAIHNYYFTDVTDVRMLIFHTPVSGHATMFRRKVFNECPAFYADIYHDWWLSMHTAIKHKLVCLQHTLTWQRVHDKNSSLQVYRLGKKEKEAKLRAERILILEKFLPGAPQHLKSIQSLQQYLSALKQIDSNRFSWRMFLYVLKNRKWVFHYKRKPFVVISHIKHAFKMAKTGV